MSNEREQLDKHLSSIQKMTVLVVNPGESPSVETISCGLESLQKQVGGNIEAIYPFEEPVGILCNDEGKINGSKLNRALRDDEDNIYDILTGTFLVVGLGNENFCSLTPEQIEKFSKLYKNPEIFFMLDGNIQAIPYNELNKYPLYEKSFDEARKRGEVSAFRLSSRADGMCKTAIEIAITFLHPRQKRNIRLRSLGEGYSEEEIKAIIKNNKNHREKKSNQKTKTTNLLIDVKQKLAEGKGKGYENWAKVFNLKQMAKTVLYLQENGFSDYDEFSKKADEMTAKINELREEIKNAENRIDELTVLREQIINYLNTRETFAKYKASGYSKKFYAEHESEIILHRAAKNKFNELGLKKLPTVKSINTEYSELMAKNKKAYSEYYSIKDKHREMLIHKSNIETILGISSENKKREKTKDKTQDTIS